MATALTSAVPLKDRIYRSQTTFRHPLLHATTDGRRMPNYKNCTEKKCAIFTHLCVSFQESVC